MNLIRGIGAAYLTQKKSGINRESNGNIFGGTVYEYIFRSELFDIKVMPGKEKLKIIPYKGTDCGLKELPERIYKSVTDAEYGMLMKKKDWKKLNGQSIERRGLYFRIYSCRQSSIEYLKVEEIFSREIRIYKGCDHEI